jgi:divalent metal cation (Fe/Co/Zn/Cd) transporter
MSTFALPLGSSAAPAPGPDRATVERLARRARILSWLSLVWMTVEGTVAILAGVAAGSIALIGFGLDSAVEGLASVIIIWRFTGHRIHSAAAEDRSQKLVAIQFFLLAPYVAVESARALIGGERPDETLVGILLACGSVVFMPMLGIAKQRIADQLGSAATRGEGRQNMLCAYLAGALLVGLLGNAWLDAWWLDATVGLLIAGVAVKEGLEAWRGEGCCVSAAPGLDVAADRCADDRCVAEPATHDDC